MRIRIALISFGIVLVSIFGLAGSAWAMNEATQQQIRELQAQIAALEAQAAQYRDGIAEQREKAASLNGEIAILKGQIGSLQAQISSTGAKITKTELEIGEVRDKIGQAREELEHKRDAVGRMMLFLDQSDRQSLLASLFKFASMSQFLSQLHDLASIQSRVMNAITELKEVKATLESDQAELESKQTDLEQLKDEADQRKQELSNVKYQKDKLLIDTKGQEAEYQKLLTETEKQKREANLEIFRLEEALRRALDPNSLPLARPGILAWPVQVKGTITQTYGCLLTTFARRNYPDCTLNNKSGGFHNGFDIAAPYGTRILAADDGKVVAIGNAPRAYGIWLVIEHESGLLTAYTHMSARDLNVGEVVKRGDSVGRIGSTGLSTGNHIHFMVYAPKTFSVQKSTVSGTLPIGATLNPVEYLDVN